MNRDSHNALAVLAVAAVFATAAFIFGNSLQGSEASWQASNVVARLLEPALQALHGVFLHVTAAIGLPGAISYGVFVRKLAHFCEYALLGLECSAVTSLVCRRAVSPYVWADLFAVLAVAVADEFVQSFVDRTSLVADVILDFSGGLAGIALAIAIAGALDLRRR